MTEVEAKVSMADWKADSAKPKFKMEMFKAVNYFWYAVPKELASRWKEAKIPEYAGVIAIGSKDGSWTFDIVKNAECRKARKWRVASRHKLLRLGSMRYWNNYPESLPPTTGELK